MRIKKKEKTVFVLTVFFVPSFYAFLAGWCSKSPREQAYNGLWKEGRKRKGVNKRNVWKTLYALAHNQSDSFSLDLPRERADSLAESKLFFSSWSNFHPTHFVQLALGARRTNNKLPPNLQLAQLLFNLLRKGTRGGGGRKLAKKKYLVLGKFILLIKLLRKGI